MVSTLDSAHLIGIALFYPKCHGKYLERFSHKEVIASDHSSNYVETRAPETIPAKQLSEGLKTKQFTWEATGRLGKLGVVGWPWI